jgi:hypothetical protein
VIKAIGHDNIRVNLQNNRYLFVGVVNSAFGSLQGEQRKAKAKEIAGVAYRSLPSRNSLQRVRVAFVIHKSYFLIFNYDDARASYAFTPQQLANGDKEGPSNGTGGTAEQWVDERR